MWWAAGSLLVSVNRERISTEVDLAWAGSEHSPEVQYWVSDASAGMRTRSLYGGVVERLGSVIVVRWSFNGAVSGWVGCGIRGGCRGRRCIWRQGGSNAPATRFLDLFEDKTPQPMRQRCEA